MNYAKDYKNENSYISVDTLTKPQRKPNLSLVSSGAATEQQNPVQASSALPLEAPGQDTFLNPGASVPGSRVNNPAEPDKGQAADQADPAAELPVQNAEAAASPGEQDSPAADTAGQSTETGPAQTDQAENAADTTVQSVGTGAAEHAEDEALMQPENEFLLQGEDEALEVEEGSKPGQESTRTKDKGMAATASGADPNTGSRPPVTVQLAGDNTGSGNGVNTLGLSITGEALTSMGTSGEPLPEGLRRNMEAAMGTGFGNVRIHRDGQSAAIAGELGAKAFTRGEDIYFKQGQYNPDTPGGRHLLTHELAHVEQQRMVSGLQYQLEAPGERDRYEHEADAVADKVVNSPTPVQSAGRQSVPAVSKISSGGIQLAKEESSSNWVFGEDRRLVEEYSRV